ncbi:unnamed protein product [Oppiella nova]|uniref:Uncharacterized protein n=1 Tax=Oppiella nova TaxID=334625 RepID=A0A7R9MFS8_9ACAR|nr:unnamed protein product [Oppiella nova]CAG2175594.1 unnamed protein product [Oppiella nova]
MVKVYVAVIFVIAVYLHYADAQVINCKCGTELGRMCGARREIPVPRSEPYLTGIGCVDNALYDCRMKHGHPILIANCPVEACEQHKEVGEDVCLVI